MTIINRLNKSLSIPMVLIIGILCSCENDIQQAESLSQKKKDPISKGTNVELIYSEKANVKIKVAAPLMEEYGLELDKYYEMREGIKVMFYDSVQKVTSTLTSNYAIHRVGERIMEAKDDVVVVNEKGEKLNTEHLIWNEDSAKIYSNEFVKNTTTD